MKKKTVLYMYIYFILKISNATDMTWYMMFAGNFTGSSHLIAVYRVLRFIYCVANNLIYVLASACE